MNHKIFAKLFLAAAVLPLAGCFGTFTTRSTTPVPVPVECKEKVPARPAMHTDAFTTKPDLDALVKAQDAEIVVREAYEVELRTALVACTSPLQ